MGLGAGGALGALWSRIGGCWGFYGAGLGGWGGFGALWGGVWVSGGGWGFYGVGLEGWGVLGLYSVGFGGLGGLGSSMGQGLGGFGGSMGRSWGSWERLRSSVGQIWGEISGAVCGDIRGAVGQFMVQLGGSGAVYGGSGGAVGQLWVPLSPHRPTSSPPPHQIRSVGPWSATPHPQVRGGGAHFGVALWGRAMGRGTPQVPLTTPKPHSPPPGGGSAESVGGGGRRCGPPRNCWRGNER